MAELEIREAKVGAASVAEPVGRIDAASADELETRLLALLGGGAARLVVDMHAVDYISSAGLRVLLRLARKARERSSRVVLCDLTPAVRQVFELAGFLELFELEASRELALQRLAGSGAV